MFIEKYSYGDEVKISNYQNGWFEIGKDRWVSADYVHNTYGIVTANTLNIDDFIKNNWSRWVVPVLGSFYRFHNTSKVNKDLLNESLNSIKPLYEDPKRFERNVYGDYASLS